MNKREKRKKSIVVLPGVADLLRINKARYAMVYVDRTHIGLLSDLYRTSYSFSSAHRHISVHFLHFFSFFPFFCILRAHDCTFCGPYRKFVLPGLSSNG